ncbi:unnamed protein product [Brassicogethes aeneus]|uniref:BESS domain-containing protein n=1 Tax=Brassicogethes aeneus TaxID=1431903 RepID=A0A9P0FHT1_BRAAE|nr:unnamed protein product [Brassicogethes aeneus]
MPDGPKWWNSSMWNDREWVSIEFLGIQKRAKFQTRPPRNRFVVSGRDRSAKTRADASGSKRSVSALQTLRCHYNNTLNIKLAVRSVQNHGRRPDSERNDRHRDADQVGGDASGALEHEPQRFFQPGVAAEGLARGRHSVLGGRFVETLARHRQAAERRYRRMIIADPEEGSSRHTNETEENEDSPDEDTVGNFIKEEENVTFEKEFIQNYIVKNVPGNLNKSEFVDILGAPTEDTSTNDVDDPDKMFLLSMLPLFKKLDEEKKMTARIELTLVLQKLLFPEKN